MSERFNIIHGHQLDIAWELFNKFAKQLYSTNRKCRFCLYEHNRRFTLICLRLGFAPRVNANDDCGHPTKGWKTLYWCYNCNRMQFITWKNIWLTLNGWVKQ